MSDKPEFRPWPKISRYSEEPEEIVITEKMDGVNACINMWDGNIVSVQSRKRIITPENNNMGFATWVEENKDGLVALGNGYHFGEWVGPGIQKNPHKLDKKTFYLFNTFRPRDSVPEGLVEIVPVMYKGNDHSQIEKCLDSLRYVDYTPEGIIIYYTQSRIYKKYTFRGNEPKWKISQNTQKSVKRVLEGKIQRLKEKK